MTYTILVILFSFFAIYVDLALKDFVKKRQLTIITFVVLAICVGLRNPMLWSDAVGYQYAFDFFTSTFSNFSFSDRPFGYSEFGFYFLGVIIKSFINNSTFYFIIVSLLSFYFLYKYEHKYSLLPLLGLYVYMGRFLVGRNMMQMRAALAIPIILLATEYANKQKIKQFLLVVLLGYFIHHSSLMALPLYFLEKLKITKNYVIISLFIAFGISILGGGFIKSICENSSFVNDMASSYIQEDSEKAFSSSLLNPMIYYQMGILLLFTFGENKLKRITPYYYTFRNGYLYSTILLIVLYQYAIVSARTATIFATYEISIVPMLLFLYPKKNRMIPLCFIIAIYAAFFFLNWKPIEVSDLELMKIYKGDF